MVAYRRGIAVTFCLWVGLANSVSSAGEPWTGLQVLRQPGTKTDVGVEEGSAEAAILKKLEARVRIRVRDMPLVQLFDLIQERLEIPIHIDAKARDEFETRMGPPVTVNSEDIRMRSLLELVLEWFDLAWGVRNEKLVVTSGDYVESVQAIRVYDLADFPATAGEEFDYDSLIELITDIVEPYNWDFVGGPASILPVDASGIRALSITATQQVHAKVACLLDELRVRLPCKGCRPFDARQHLARQAKRNAVRAALGRECTGSYFDVNVRDFLQCMAHTMETEIHLDRDLKARRIGPDKPVTLEAAGISVGASLGLVLHDQRMDFAVVDDFIVVSDKDSVGRFDDFRVYDITDLCRSPQDVEYFEETLQNSIEPASWEEFGGYGRTASITYAGRTFLVISQRWQTLEKIEKWLGDVRAVRKARYRSAVPRQRRSWIRCRTHGYR